MTHIRHSESSDPEYRRSPQQVRQAVKKSHTKIHQNSNSSRKEMQQETVNGKKFLFVTGRAQMNDWLDTIKVSATMRKSVLNCAVLQPMPVTIFVREIRPWRFYPKSSAFHEFGHVRAKKSFGANHERQWDSSLGARSKIIAQKCCHSASISSSRPLDTTQCRHQNKPCIKAEWPQTKRNRNITCAVHNKTKLEIEEGKWKHKSDDLK